LYQFLNNLSLSPSLSLSLLDLSPEYASKQPSQQGSKAARQQGSKAARQQGSKAARQQGSKAARRKSIHTHTHTHFFVIDSGAK
jgi:hypothetical protein